VTAIFSPSGATFLRGNDVIGVADNVTGDLTTVANELYTWQPFYPTTGLSPTIAMLWFNSAYSTSHSYSQVAYNFLCRCINPGIQESFVFGGCVVNNATVSTVGIITPYIRIDSAVTGSGGAGGAWPLNTFSFNDDLSGSSNSPHGIAKFLDDVNGNGILQMFNSSGVQSVAVNANTVRAGTLNGGAVFTYDVTGNNVIGQL
jgi:hypothetical protein